MDDEQARYEENGGAAMTGPAVEPTFVVADEDGGTQGDRLAGGGLAEACVSRAEQSSALRLPSRAPW